MLLFSKHSLGSTICTARRAKRASSPEWCAIVSTQHVILDKSLYLTEPLSLHKMTCLLQPWKDLGLFWFDFFERYSGLCNWQMISCLDILMLWIIDAFSFSILSIWQSGCEVPWANFSKSTGGLWLLEHLRKESAWVHKEGISLSPKKTQILKNLSSLHKRIYEYWFSALILQKAVKRCHFLLKSTIRDILLVCFLINFLV